MTLDSGASNPPHLTVEFGHEPTASRQARLALRNLVSPEDDPISDAVELVASELVSNVIKHTNGGGTMRVWDPKPDVPFRLEVTDSGPGQPAPSGDGQGIGGRGLHIVAGLSDFWGVIQHTAGKTVWAEFYRPTQ